MPTRKNYKLKLVCVNCGMRGFYQAPMGAEFWPVVTETSVPHSYEPSHIELHDESREDLKCRNCNVPCLDIQYWDEEPATRVKELSGGKAREQRG